MSNTKSAKPELMFWILFWEVTIVVILALCIGAYLTFQALAW